MGQSNAHAVREQEEHIRQLFGEQNGGPVAYCHLMIAQAQQRYSELMLSYGHEPESPECEEQLRYIAKWQGALEEERARLIGQVVAETLASR